MAIDPASKAVTTIDAVADLLKPSPAPSPEPATAAQEEGEEEDQEQAEAAGEPADAQSEEGESEDQEEATEEQPFAESIRFAGREIPLPQGTPKEVAERVAQVARELDADYTRKTQEAAEVRKSAEAAQKSFSQLTELAQRHLDGIAHIKGIDAQINAYQQAISAALAAGNQDQATQLVPYVLQLQSQRSDAVRAIEQAEANAKQEQMKLLSEAHRKGLEDLHRRIGPMDAKKREAIVKATLEVGYSDDEVGQWMDPRALHLAWKAAQWDALQRARPQVTKRAVEAPKLPPTRGQRSINEEARMASEKRFRDKPSVETLAGLIRI